MMRWRCWHVMVLAAAVVTMAGCGGSGGEATAPWITSAAVTPDELSFRGGEVGLEVRAQPVLRVTRVTARITSAEIDETIDLVRQSNVWLGEWMSPPNGTATVCDYAVTFLAVDAEELESAPVQRGFRVGVADDDEIPLPPPPPPPAPPAEG